MDPNENKDFPTFDDILSQDTVEIPVIRQIAPEESPVAEPTPVAQEPQIPEPAQPAASVYHGAGVGKKESPYANSPYYTYVQTGQIPEPAPKTKKAKKPRRVLKTITAAVLTLALVATGCGITGWMVNRHWESRTQDMQAQFQTQIAALQQQIAGINAANANVSTSGSPVASQGGLTPAQIYAMNVNSVVAITNYAAVSSGWSSQSYQAAGAGSGFILSEDGYIVTNYHVVEGSDALSVTTYLGQEYEATLVGSDDINDVALLKIEAESLVPVVIGSSDDLLVGDMVVAIGNPLGELTATQTVGYISGKDRAVSTDGTIINMIQTDAAINSGNSGGPLFNTKGQVVGITTAKYSGSSSSGATIEGIGFAIPIDDVLSMIDDFKNYGYLKNQAYLGVTVRSLDSATGAIYSLPSGSYVETVEEGGSADRAGVQPKDIIIAIGDYTVDGNSTLTTALRRFSAGDTTTITVYRAGQEVTLEITFDEKPQELVNPNAPEQSGSMPESGNYEDWYNYFFPTPGGE